MTSKPPPWGLVWVRNLTDALPAVGRIGLVVGLFLLKHANNDTRECYPKISTLAKETKSCERSIRRALAALEAAGLIRRKPRVLDSGVNTSNLYTLTPRKQADTRDGLPRPECQGEGDRRDGGRVTPEHHKLPQDELPLFNSQEKTPAKPAHDPGLLELIEGWNSLGPSIVKPGNGSKLTPPSKAVLKGWTKAMNEPEQRDALQDIPRLIEAIRSARFCHGQGWFTLAWVFGKNKNGEFNLTKLLTGAYDSKGNTNESSGTGGPNHVGRPGRGVGPANPTRIQQSGPIPDRHFKAPQASIEGRGQ